MQIDFMIETFLEDDCSWDALFFRVNNSNWHLAKPVFNTEDEKIITNKIYECPDNWK